ncbi:hypothetical protein CMI41_03335 [Candidatus Pacearchaeota archaeon]|nr:hypothetical protein [Candidatus Pacearchaeota archaeon]|tara:strand:- start:3397 stop:3951 length:555 start_codon:yes stop_codon:yes gene_type:complete
MKEKRKALYKEITRGTLYAAIPLFAMSLSFLAPSYIGEQSALEAIPVPKKSSVVLEMDRAECYRRRVCSNELGTNDLGWVSHGPDNSGQIRLKECSPDGRRSADLKSLKDALDFHLAAMSITPEAKLYTKQVAAFDSEKEYIRSHYRMYDSVAGSCLAISVSSLLAAGIGLLGMGCHDFFNDGL